MIVPSVTKTGPSWQWLTNVLLGILLSVIGGLIGWIALTTYDLGIQVSQLSTQTSYISRQISALETKVNTLDSRFTRLDERSTTLSTELAARLDSTTDESDRNNDWITAHVLADEAIRKARLAKSPKRFNYPQVIH